MSEMVFSTTTNGRSAFVQPRSHTTTRAIRRPQVKKFSPRVTDGMKHAVVVRKIGESK